VSHALDVKKYHFSCVEGCIYFLNLKSRQVMYLIWNDVNKSLRIVPENELFNITIHIFILFLLCYSQLPAVLLSQEVMCLYENPFFLQLTDFAA
jgi:hypothetical protein